MTQASQSVADQVATINAELATAVDAARRDATLSNTGKSQKIAREYAKAAAAVKQLEETEHAHNLASQTMLERELFGSGNTSGADAISVRDAHDRAAQLETPEEAAALLTRSERLGDSVLSRAVVHRAFELATTDPLAGHAWEPVVQQYATRRPDTSTKFNTLAELRRTAAPSSTLESLQHVAKYYVPKPPEVQSMTEGQVAAAQETAPEQAQIRQWPGLAQPLPPEAPYGPGYPVPGR